MTGRVQVLASADEVAHAAAEAVADAIRSRATTRLVLAGGSTPRRSYELLAAMTLPWGRVSVLFGDERCVPPHDPDSNFRMADDALLRRVAPASVHRIPAELGPAAGAALYEPVVAVAPLDLVLLGVGPDGHTASLFPGNAVLTAEGLVAGVWDAPKPPPERVTLTLRALRAASRVVILATGADKREAVRRALVGGVPAGMIPARSGSCRAMPPADAAHGASEPAWTLPSSRDGDAAASVDRFIRRHAMESVSGERARIAPAEAVRPRRAAPRSWRAR